MSSPPSGPDPVLPDRAAPRAGVVGLGMIGGGVAVSLARRGRIPAVYDIRPDAADSLPGVPAQLGSPAEVARVSDVVLVAVVDADQARVAIGADDGILSGAHPGLVVVLLSTVALPVVHDLAARCAGAGASLLDCGVTPGNKAAENGMVAILGGPDDVVARAMPVLEDFAKTVVHCGPLGAGMVTKIARNMITYGAWRTVYEASALARAAQVPPDKLLTVIEESDPEGLTLLTLEHLYVDGVLPPDHVEKIAQLWDKDLAAAQDLAADLGMAIPLVDVARSTAAQTLRMSES